MPHGSCAMSTYFSLKSAGEFALTGAWSVATLPAIEAEIAATPIAHARAIIFDGTGLQSCDTSATWVLICLMHKLEKKGAPVTLRHFDAGHKRLIDRLAKLTPAKDTPPRKLPPVTAMLVALGHTAESLRKDFVRDVTFFGEFVSGLPARLMMPKRLRLQSVVFHINEVGIKAIPIIALMAFSIAFVMGYQGAFQLQKFDATAYTVDLITLSTLREMGVLITSIMIAGRSGSAFAAQIGTMKLNEEVDALRTMGVSPFEALALPRILAILIALPLLTVIADVMGLVGGYIFSSSYMDYSYTQFLSRVQEAADMKQFWIGVSKAPVFALLIGITGCMQGLQAHGSAEDVGRKTITSVVQSIFLVIVADAIFSVIFTRLGI